MNDYKYRLLTFDDIAKINLLFKACFHNDPKDSFITWKYFSNPYGRALFVGAFYNDILVGSGAMIPEKINFYDKEETVFKFTDLMTHPTHQKKGVLKNIIKILGEEIMKMEFSLSYTLCSKISTKSFVRNNWIFMNSIINFFKPRILLKISLLFQKNNFSKCKIYNNLDNCLDLYKFKNDTSCISLKKTLDFIKWRTSNPNFIYKCICSYDNNDKINGYLIYSFSKNNLLNIIDIESSNNDLDIEIQLLHYAEFIAVKEKYKGVLVLAIKNRPFYNFIKSNNYIINPFNKGPLKTSLDFDICLYDKNLTKFANVKNWDIKGINYDDI